MNIFKLFQVTWAFEPKLPRVAYVEALSIADAQRRVIREFGPRTIEAIASEDGYAVLLPVGERERAEVEHEAHRIGLGEN